MHRSIPSGAGSPPEAESRGDAVSFSSGPEQGQMSLLFAGRVADYLAAATLTAGPCIFVHVPKTAGTSLRAELAAILRPDANIHVDYTDTSRSFNERLDDAVARFLDQAGPRGIRFASGHIQARHTASIAEHMPEARFITLLREPAARVVSDFRHQRSPRQPGHEAFRQRVPNLETYLELRGERDKMAVHLVPAALRAQRDIAGCIAHVTRHFAFVGIQDMYDLSFRTLTTLAGRPALPRLRANVADAGDGEAAISADTAARIRALNPIDTALYEHFAERLGSVRDRLEAGLPDLA